MAHFDRLGMRNDEYKKSHGEAGNVPAKTKKTGSARAKMLAKSELKAELKALPGTEFL